MEINYERKYLKYKQKYLELKFGGGIFTKKTQEEIEEIKKINKGYLYELSKKIKDNISEYHTKLKDMKNKSEFCETCTKPKDYNDGIKECKRLIKVLKKMYKENKSNNILNL